MPPTIVQHCRIHQERGAEQPAGVFGTEPGVPVYKDMRILTEDIGGGPDLSVESDASQQFGYTDVDRSGKKYEGRITSKCRADEISHFLMYLFGKITSSSLGGAPAAYSHVYIPLDDLTLVAPSFGIDLAIEKKRMYRFKGCLIDRIVISKVGAKEVEITYDLIAKSRTTAAFDSGHTPSYSVKTKLSTVQTATLYGQAITWESLTITLNRNWDKTMAFSSDTLPDAEIGMFTAKIEGVVKFENSNPNFIDSYEAETEGEMTIVFRGPLISGTNYEELKIEFDRLHITASDPPHINPSRKTQSIEAEALVPTAGDWVKVTVQNDVATPATYP